MFEPGQFVEGKLTALASLRKGSSVDDPDKRRKQELKEKGLRTYIVEVPVFAPGATISKTYQKGVDAVSGKAAGEMVLEMAKKESPEGSHFIEPNVTDREAGFALGDFHKVLVGENVALRDLYLATLEKLLAEHPPKG